MKNIKKFQKIQKIQKARKLRSVIKYSAKLAQRLVDPSYYRAQGRNLREFAKLEKVKIKLSTPPWEKVSKLLDYYKESAENSNSSTDKTLIGIFNRNKECAIKGIDCYNSKLLSVVAKPETLILAYKAIKNNKGAMTRGGEVSQETYNNMSEKTRTLYLKGLTFPDGINFYYFFLMSELLIKGRYPWGTSARVYFDKSGQPGKKSPIPIPPFPDRIVQKAIEMVLQSIYEPVFEKRNRSFGFRPNVGTQDAVIAVTSKYNTLGMRTAIEGDVEAAYDTVNRRKLIEILNKRIKDKKFLKLIKDRLNYDYIEITEKGVSRYRPTLGIPQGGIDSPYLLNIYLNELDDFVYGPLTQEINRLNDKLKHNDEPIIRIINQNFTSNRARKKRLIRILAKVKTKIKNNNNPIVVEHLRRRIFSLVKSIRLNEHQKNRISSATSNSKKLRIFYIRYADDWIILTNGNREIGEMIKRKMSDFLWNNLYLKLSLTKTLVTDICKNPAKFLGFELKISERGAIIRTPFKVKNQFKKLNLQKRSGLLVWASPDRQRLINRLHMKGFCNRNGFPTTIPWLSCLEAHSIIERFNSMIRGLAEYYLPVVRNRAKIHRWIYILRFSCLKTLAQKFHCTIKKILKRFGHNLHSKKSQTVRIRVTQKVGNDFFYKDWPLLTYSDVIRIIDYKKINQKLVTAFMDRENGLIGDYPIKSGKIPKITNEDYLDKNIIVNP